MARTQSVDVVAILGRDYATAQAPSLDGYIATANAMVNRVAQCAIDNEDPLSDVELELIERWLAAHYYCQSDKPYASKSTGGASASFHGQTAMRLESTLYGQTALGLDFSGCLDGLTKGNVATMTWLGKRPSEQIDYADRD